MSKRQLTVIDVSGDPGIASVNAAVMEHRGYTVLKAATGADCLRLTKEGKPDIVLLSTALPDVDTASVCRTLKADAETRRTLIILIDPPDPARNIELTVYEPFVDGYLAAPYSGEELHGCLLSMERIRQSEDRMREQEAGDRTAQLRPSNETLQRESTGRPKLDDGIKTREMFFREVTENSSDMVLILNKRGIITYASPSVERFLGYAPEEMTGKSSFRFIDRPDVERAMRDFGEAVRMEEIAIPNTFRVVHKDGSQRILEGLGKNLLDNPVIAGFVMNVHDVTERIKVEEASRLFLHTLESISEFVTITDLEDRFTFVNQAFLKAYGYERDEVIGRSVGMLWSPNNPEGLLQEILGQNRTRNWNGELLNLTKDGREFPIALHTSRIVNDKGEVIGLVGVSEDITERKKAETRLRESEAKYRDLVEQISEVIFATDSDGRFTYVSPTAELLSGYKPDEMLGHSIVEFIDPAFLPTVMKRYQNPGPGELEPLEYRVRLKAGEFRWVRSSSKMILEGGKPVGMRGVLVDITAEKQAQETVNLLSHAIKSVGECVSITDHRNVILFVNQSFLSTYGFSEEELLGKHISIVNPEVRTVGSVLQGTLLGGWHGELINRRKDGTEFPVFLSTSVVLDENQNAIALVGVATDISERKRIETELGIQKKHLQESYEQLQQLEVARDTLVHMIVHDMRSRLFVLMMGLEFLEQNELNHIGEPNRKVLLQALATTADLSRMVNSLLDISKMESGDLKLRPAKCDLTEIAGRLLLMYDLQRKERQFSVDAPARPVEIICDADLILRVMQNLFSNALKFTPEDGSIVIRIKESEGEIRVFVQDTGSGIPAQHLPKIFDKFYQVEVRGESTGLGLTFCRLAVELHGGRIGVESEPGKGSTFWFTLPKEKR